MESKVFRYDDLYMLRGAHYISDSIINFYFNYLSSTIKSTDILLVSPSVSFWAANCSDPQSVKECLDPLHLSSKNLVIFAISNNNNINEEDGGTHWSLLVFYRKMKAFVHHDSVEGVNYESALSLYNSIKDYFYCSSDYLPPDIIISTASSKSSFSLSAKKRKKRVTIGGGSTAAGAKDFPVFFRGETPQQTNEYDCGLYVMAIAKVVCEWYEDSCCDSDEEDGNWFSKVNEEVQRSLELSKRDQVLQIIAYQAILV